MNHCRSHPRQLRIEGFPHKVENRSLCDVFDAALDLVGVALLRNPEKSALAPGEDVLKMAGPVRFPQASLTCSGNAGMLLSFQNDWGRLHPVVAAGFGTLLVHTLGHGASSVKR